MLSKYAERLKRQANRLPLRHGLVARHINFDQVLMRLLSQRDFDAPS